MNLWQMNGGTLGKFHNGVAYDQHNKPHQSTHPNGRKNTLKRKKPEDKA